MPSHKELCVETNLSSIKSNDNWPKDVSFNVNKLKNTITFNLTNFESVCKKMMDSL